MDCFLEFFDRFRVENPLLVESIAAGYKICHPDALDDISVISVLAYGDGHYLSQKQDTSFTPATGPSLRNPSCIKQNLAPTPLRDAINIVYESVDGKQVTI